LLNESAHLSLSSSVWSRVVWLLDHYKPNPLDARKIQLDNCQSKIRDSGCKQSWNPTLRRKNWLHIGSPQAGPRVAAILSVVESCRRLKLPVRDYLAEVLPGLADLPIKRLSSLTPSIWASSGYHAVRL